MNVILAGENISFFKRSPLKKIHLEIEKEVDIE